jgi:FixJ family two-component response regulator
MMDAGESPSPIKDKIEQTVFVVEDDLAVGQSLVDLFESSGLASVHYASAEEFLANWSQKMAGCLLLDVRLPGISGIELQTRLAERGFEIPIVVMTAHGDIPMVRKALKAGAVEFLTKPFQNEELFESIGEAFAQDLATRQKRSFSEALLERAATLSERERQVLELVTTGLTNREIADRIHLSVVTIKLYRRLGMQKMQANSLAELVKMWDKLEPDSNPR